MAYSAQARPLARTRSLSERTGPPPVLQFGAARQESTQCDSVPASLPSRDVWLHSGNMSKKIVTSSQGVKFQTRFAVLTPENLYFTKQYDER